MDFYQTYFSFLNSAEGWIALATLIAMELVLGIDNLICSEYSTARKIL